MEVCVSVCVCAHVYRPIDFRKMAHRESAMLKSKLTLA